MPKLVPERVQTSNPVIRSPARYFCATAPAFWSINITCVTILEDQHNTISTFVNNFPVWIIYQSGPLSGYSRNIFTNAGLFPRLSELPSRAFPESIRTPELMTLQLHRVSPELCTTIRTNSLPWLYKSHSPTHGGLPHNIYFSTIDDKFHVQSDNYISHIISQSTFITNFISSHSSHADLSPSTTEPRLTRPPIMARITKATLLVITPPGLFITVYKPLRLTYHASSPQQALYYT